jgi:phenylacetaldehyde dehydrogenase
MDYKDFALTEFVRSYIGRHHAMIIAGYRPDTGTGKTIEVLDPATDGAIATVSSGGAADIDLAVKSAQAALVSPEWGGISSGEREALLLKFADAVDARMDDFAQIITLESGKPLEEAQEEAGGAGAVIRYNANWAPRIQGYAMEPVSPIIPEKTAFAYTRKEPIGVVGAIIPWNFPLVNAVDRVAPALAAGCTVVLKPAETTPLSSLLLAEVALEAGLPAGVLNVVTGLGMEAGASLAAHPGIAKIAFTGSTNTGKSIAKAAMDNLSAVNLELGGKSPMIVLEDCDVEEALDWLAMGIFYNGGQCCTAGSRLLAHEKVYDKVVAGMEAQAKSLVLGHGLADDTLIGPLVSRMQQERVMRMIESGVSEGAELVAGGKAHGAEGAFVEPTVFAGVTNTMSIAREEIFGPVLSITSFADEQEALALANDTNYGLTASIWSNDLSKVNRMIPQLQAGVVWVNAHNLLDLGLPFGGYKQSGIGRENGLAGVEEFLETKSVIMYS